MNCKKCGAPLAQVDHFCGKCGERVDYQPADMGVQAPLDMPNANNFSEQPMNAAQPTYSNDAYNNQAQGYQPADMAGQGPLDMPNANSFSEQPMNAAQPTYSNDMYNNQQQAWTNYNNAPIYDTAPIKKSSSLGVYIAIASLFVVGAIMLALVLSTMTYEDDYSSSIKNTGSLNTTQTSKKAQKVVFKDFTFEIPGDFLYQEEDGGLMIATTGEVWNIQIEEGDFSIIKDNKSYFKTLMGIYGFTSSEAAEKYYAGIDFITAELTDDEQNAIMALAELDSTHMVIIAAANIENKHDYKLLETIAPIIKSAKNNANATSAASGVEKEDANNGK